MSLLRRQYVQTPEANVDTGWMKEKAKKMAAKSVKKMEKYFEKKMGKEKAASNAETSDTEKT